MALKEIHVPDIGEYDNVDVIEVFVKVGDTLKEEDPIVALETDKATMEVPAPFGGTVKELLVKEGDKVSEGSLILKVEAEGDAQAATESTSTESANSAQTDAPAATNQAQEQTITVPDIGEYDNVDVIEVHIKPGDTIAEEDPLVSLETDKATMEVPAPFSGKVVSVSIKVGDKVSQGDAVAIVTTQDGGESSSAAQADSTASTPAKQEESVSQPEQENAIDNAVVPASEAHASPAIRRFARELGVELDKVSASGRKGRVTKEDVQKFVKSVMQSQGSAASGAGLGLIPDPVVDFAKFGEVDTQPLSRIKKLSGANLARNWVRVPHISFFEDADITDLEDFRKAKKAVAEKVGVKLTPVPFIVKAVAKALVDFPNVNSSLAANGEDLVLKKYVHIGVAVDTPNGLMVPVIRDADQKGLYDIARDLMDYAKKAREGKLKPTDMQGGCFTISSLGGVGTTGFTPIVNMPEVGILGVSKAAMKPVYDGKNGFVPRLMLPLSLSVDHRVVDGAEAGSFIVSVARYLSDLRELIL